MLLEAFIFFSYGVTCLFSFNVTAYKLVPFPRPHVTLLRRSFLDLRWSSSSSHILTSATTDNEGRNTSPTEAACPLAGVHDAEAHAIPSSSLHAEIYVEKQKS